MQIQANRIKRNVSWQHIMCKLGNYQLGPLDADPMDRVRGLKRKKKGRRVGGLSVKKIPHLSSFIGSASSGPDW